MAILVVRCSRKHTVGVAVFPAGSSYRVTTYLVNLMAFDRLLLKGLLTYLLTYLCHGIWQLSGKCQGKNLVWEKWSKTVYLCPFFTLLNLCISFRFRIMNCCIPTPTTDNNTSTSMIWVTLNMDRSATNRQGNVIELSGNFTLSGEWSPCG